MGVLLAGLEEVIIAPPAGVELAGYSPRVATGLHDNLKAVALVLDDGHQRSVLCAVDIVGVSAELVSAVRRRVACETAIPAERVLIAATHTHSAPELASKNVLNQCWLHELESQLVKVILLADSHCREAKIGASTGTVEGIGGNRRDPKGFVDRSIHVVRIDDNRTGKCLGLVVNHACHPTTLGMENTLVTADYPGPLRDYVLTHHPDHPVVLFLNGACGDVNPGGYSAEVSALGKIIPHRTFARAKDIGETLGKETLRLAETIQTTDKAHLWGERRELLLPLKRMRLPTELAVQVRDKRRRVEALKHGRASEEILDKARLELLYAEESESQSRRRLSYPRGEMPVEIQGIAVNEILFLGLPGEVFGEIGAAIRKASPFHHTVIIGYANTDAGYIPTIDAFCSDSYEIHACLVGQVAVERLTEAAQRLAGEAHCRRPHGDSVSAAAT